MNRRLAPIALLFLGLFAGCDSDTPPRAPAAPATRPTAPAVIKTSNEAQLPPPQRHWTDPLPFVPPTTRPAFQQLLPANEWQVRFDRALEQVPELADLRRSTQPEDGALINIVSPGMQAARLGLPVGDIIVSVDGLSAAVVEFNVLRKDEPQQMVVWTVDGERRVTIQPGRLGIDTRTHRDLRLIYARRGKHDPAWDDLVMVALSAQESDPELAQTTWFHAISRGYAPDAISDEAGIPLALWSGRNEDALAFAHFTRRPADRMPRSAFAPALAEFKMLELTRMLEGEHDYLYAYLTTLSDAYAALPLEQRNAPPPSVQVASLNRVDLLRSCQPLNTQTASRIKRIAKGRPFTLTVAPGSFLPIEFAPPHPVGDVELVVHARLKPSAGQETVFAGHFNVSLFDLDQTSGRGPDKPASHQAAHAFLAIGIRYPDQAELLHGENRKIATVPFSLPIEDKPLTFRVIRHQGRNEVLVNDRRIFYLPSSNETTNIGAQIKVVGLTVEIESVEFVELKPKD